jgi:hypothetical protein
VARKLFIVTRNVALAVTSTPFTHILPIFASHVVDTDSLD